MGIFDIFKKDKKSVELPKEDLQWNKMWDMWTNGKIESPYAELMEYSGGVNNGGHCCHLDNIRENKDLEEYVNILASILPWPLKENVLTAYRAYVQNPDDISDENNDILDNCDNLFYENEELITQILKDRASKIEL